MTTLQEIEDAIRQLSPHQLTQLKERLADYEWEKWDEELTHDVEAGRLDALAQEALADFHAGN